MGFSILRIEKSMNHEGNAGVLSCVRVSECPSGMRMNSALASEWDLNNLNIR